MKRLILTALCSTLLLTGCTASFDVKPSSLEKYAEEHDGVFTDKTEEYSEDLAIDGLYLVDTDDAHVELWDWGNTDDCRSWFHENVEAKLETSKSYSKSNTSKAGTASITDENGDYYKICFSKDKGIFACGDKDSVHEILDEIME